MKKALHIITGLNDGGAEGVLFRLVKFSKRDIEHKVVSLTGQGKYKALLEGEGIEVECLHLNPFNFVFKFYTLCSLIKKTKPDVVQTWLYHADIIGGLASRLAGQKNMLWGLRQADFDIKKMKFATRLVMKTCAVFSGFLPRAHVTCAEAAIRSHQKIGYQGDFKVVSNGYDLAKFSSAPGQKNEVLGCNISDKQFIFGMVARFDAAKDHENLLKAFSGYLQNSQVDAKLILVGKGCDESNGVLKSYLETYQLKDRVVLLGQFTNIPSLMSCLDVHVLSSEYEGFPNVLAEAMACGIPCISTDVGDAKLIVEDNGWIVPAKNAQALAQAMQVASNLKNEPALWSELKKRCRSSVAEKYSLEKMADNFSAIWFG